MDRITELSLEIEKVCPINGVSFDGTNYRIDFKREATEEQKTVARTTLQNFDKRERRPRTYAAVFADLQTLRTNNPADFQKLQLAVMTHIVQQYPKLLKGLNTTIETEEIGG